MFFFFSSPRMISRAFLSHPHHWQTMKNFVIVGNVHLFGIYIEVCVCVFKFFSGITNAAHLTIVTIFKELPFMHNSSDMAAYISYGFSIRNWSQNWFECIERVFWS